MEVKRRQQKFYLDDFGFIHVYVLGSISASNTVVVNFRAGTARSNVSHLPKVIGHTEREHSALGEVPVMIKAR